MNAFNSPRHDGGPIPTGPAWSKTTHTRMQHRAEDWRIERTKTGVSFLVTGIRVELRDDAAAGLRDALTASLRTKATAA
ncbi:hypothetical protein [Rhodococcus ruber]